MCRVCDTPLQKTFPAGALQMWMMWGSVLPFLVSAAWAREAEVAVVGAHLPNLSDAQAQQVAVVLEATLGETRNLEPVDPGRVRGRLSGREALVVEGVFLAPGRRALDEGRVLYERADFEGAVGALEDAVAALGAGLAGAGESKDLIDALLLLGLANAAFGEEEAARSAFARVVALEPQRQLDRFNYPPKFVTLFNEVRDSVLAGPRVSLDLITPDDTERILLDGRPLPRADRTTRISDLIPGEHYVLVEGAEGRRAFEVVSLPVRGDALKVTPDLRLIASAAETTADRAEQTALLYRSLGEHIETDLVLLAGMVSPDQVGVQFYEPRTGHFSRIEAEPVGGGAPVEALQRATRRLSVYVEDGALLVSFVELGAAPLNINDNPLLSSMLLDPEPFVEKVVERRGAPWYVWAGVSTVAAGGAAGAVFLLTSTDPPENATTGTILVNLPD